MARIIGAVMTSHVPAIANAMAKGQEQAPYWKPFFDGFPPVHRWLAKSQPDTAVIVYNDHGLNFFLDKMPTFAIGTAPEYRNEDEGWGIPTVPAFAGDADLSWHLADSMVGEGFDLTTCQEMLVDHAVANPMSLLWPGGEGWPVRLVPLEINTVQHPLPSAARCFKLGEALGRAIESYEEDRRVLVIGSGGLSHQLDGARAGFINKDFDLRFMASLTEDPTWATSYSMEELVELSGSQGVELIMWLAARASLLGGARKVTSTYHVPISNTAGAVLLLEPEA